jgi:hypothetical protein
MYEKKFPNDFTICFTIRFHILFFMSCQNFFFDNLDNTYMYNFLNLHKKRKVRNAKTLLML